MKRWMPGTVFLLTWFSVAAWQIPAGPVAAWLDLPVAASGWSGTIWRGAADDVSVVTPAGRVALGRVNWSVQPASLWRGNLCLSMDSALHEQQVSGTVCRAKGGGLQVEGLSAESPVAAWADALALGLRGDLVLLVESLHIEQGRIAALKSRASWSRAAFHDGTQWTELPVIVMRGQPAHEGGLALQFHDQGESLTPLTLDIESGIDRQGRYHTRGRITTTTQTPESLMRWLPVIARAEGGGEFHIDWTGALEWTAHRRPAREAADAVQYVAR
ncbi:MAG: type II secretion system protein N [Pseudohongiellaceae bacterium]